MFLLRTANGEIVSTPTVMGFGITEAGMRDAVENCAHEWQDFGPPCPSPPAPAGCEMRAQKCTRCWSRGVMTSRVCITGPQALLDAYVATLESVETRPLEPGKN